METAISDRIYERFLSALQEAGADGRRVAEEVTRLYHERQLQDERALVEAFERLAERPR